MRNQRKSHWQDFVADAKNIWNVLRYLDPSKGSSFSQIPALKNIDGQLVASEPELAQVLLEEFFKNPPEVATDSQGTRIVTFRCLNAQIRCRRLKKKSEVLYL